MVLERDCYAAEGMSEARPKLLLAAELEFYEQHFDEYAKRYPGQHLLICGRELIGAYPTRREAVSEGYRLGVSKMLVRESGTREKPVFIPTILRA